MWFYLCSPPQQIFKSNDKTWLMYWLYSYTDSHFQRFRCNWTVEKQNNGKLNKYLHLVQSVELVFGNCLLNSLYYVPQDIKKGWGRTLGWKNKQTCQREHKSLTLQSSMFFKRRPAQKQDLKDHRKQLKWNIAEFFPWFKKTTKNTGEEVDILLAVSTLQIHPHDKWSAQCVSQGANRWLHSATWKTD